MISTDIAAWWGAIIATSVLLWDFIKWTKSGPRIKATAKMPTHYPDAEIISTEETENGTVTTYKEYCHVEVINSGNLPTTIISLCTTHIKTKKHKFIAGNDRYSPHHGKTLPYVLGPGEMWSCRVETDIVNNMKQNGTPIIEVRLSHIDNPLGINIYDYAKNI